MLKQRLKENFKFTKKEVMLILISVVVTAVILPFRMWGAGDKFDFNTGIENLILTLLISTIALFAHFAWEKFYAVRKGFKTNYEINYIGLLIAFFIAVMFNGFFFILAPGYMAIEAVKLQRLGKWRNRSYFREYGYLAMNGILVNLAIAGIASFFMGNNIADMFIRANIAIAIFSLIPAPKYDGFHIFFASFYQYAFIVCFTAAFSILLYTMGFWYAVIAGLVMGAFGFLFIFKKREEKNLKGL